MNTILTSGRAEILIEKGKEGMGICFSGPLPENPSLQFQEAHDLLEGLIEYLGEEKGVEGSYKKASSNIYVPLIPIPRDASSWIISETPYTWKGGVIVSQDSLRYYESLYHNLMNEAGHSQSEVSQIVYLRRAACCKDIINGLYKALE